MTQLISEAAFSWLATSDAVIRGLNHEFSNRLSLARLAPQLTAMLAAGDPELRKIAADAQQTDQLMELLSLYRLMVFGGHEPAEAMLVSDTIANAIALFKHHTAFGDCDVRVTSGDAIPPVLMDPAGLTQGMLLVMCAAASRGTGGHEAPATVVVEITADANAVKVSARAEPANDTPSGTEPRELPALRYLLRDAAGVVETDGARVTMSIATLVRLRQREKQG